MAPRDSLAVFVRHGKLLVIGGRGDVWHYDPSVTTDAAGKPIEGPADVEYAQEGPAHSTNVLVIQGDGTAWILDLNSGTWARGYNVDELVPGSDKQTTDPWKPGLHNATARAPKPELAELPTGKAA